MPNSIEKKQTNILQNLLQATCTGMPYFGPYLHAVAVGPLDTVTMAAYSEILFTLLL